MKTALPGLLVWLTFCACDDDTLVSRRQNAPDRCGDSAASAEEACDGSDLKGATCLSLGFDEGSLSCTAECQFNTLACVKRCGNGQIDVGEECDGLLGPLDCSPWGYKACNSACQIDATHCVSTPYETSTSHDMAKGGPSIIADLSPKGYAELIVAVPSMGRLETFPYSTEQGFQSGRKLSFGDFPIFPQASDLDADGAMDLAAIDASGSVIRYRFDSTSNLFVRQTLPASTSGTACGAFRWIGRGDFNGDAVEDLVALGCPSLSTPLRASGVNVYLGGSSPTAPSTSTTQPVVDGAVADFDGDDRNDVILALGNSAAIQVLRFEAGSFVALPELSLPEVPDALGAGDLDADKDVDLVVFTGNFVKVLENIGVGFAERERIPTESPASLLVSDLDGDRRLDFAWLSKDKALVRRNMGAFQFSAIELSTGNGAPLNLAFGDLDVDGDTDLAATYVTSGDATRTHLFVNKAH